MYLDLSEYVYLSSFQVQATLASVCVVKSDQLAYFDLGYLRETHLCACRLCNCPRPKNFSVPRTLTPPHRRPHVTPLHHCSRLVSGVSFSTYEPVAYTQLAERFSAANSKARNPRTSHRPFSPVVVGTARHCTYTSVSSSLYVAM